MLERWPNRLLIQVEDDTGASAEAVVPQVAPLDLFSDVLGRDDFKTDSVLALEIEADTGAGGRIPVRYMADCCGRRTRAHFTAFSIDEGSEEGAGSKGISGTSGNQQLVFVDVVSTRRESGEVSLEADVVGEVDLRGARTIPSGYDCPCRDSSGIHNCREPRRRPREPDGERRR